MVSPTSQRLKGGQRTGSGRCDPETRPRQRAQRAITGGDERRLRGEAALRQSLTKPTRSHRRARQGPFYQREQCERHLGAEECGGTDSSLIFQLFPCPTGGAVCTERVRVPCHLPYPLHAQAARWLGLLSHPGLHVIPSQRVTQRPRTTCAGLGVSADSGTLSAYFASTSLCFFDDVVNIRRRAVVHSHSHPRAHSCPSGNIRPFPSFFSEHIVGKNNTMMS